MYSGRKESVRFTAAGLYQQIPLCSGGNTPAKTNYVGPFPMNVNTSGFTDGVHGAVSNAGETLTEAERCLHATSFEVHSWLGLFGQIRFLWIFFKERGELNPF